MENNINFSIVIMQFNHYGSVMGYVMGDAVLAMGYVMGATSKQ